MRRTLALIGVLAALAAASLVLMTSPSEADECIGAVVNGGCVGAVMRNPGNLGRPDDSFHNDGQGYHTSPYPGTRMEGSQLHDYDEPDSQPGRGLRWKDEHE